MEKPQQIIELEKVLGFELNEKKDFSKNKFYLLNDKQVVISLGLCDCELKDVSFLVSLSNLEILNLSSNQISDYSFLTSLSNLTYLDLAGNQISDISFVTSLSNLKILNLNSNQISDISFLASLSNLTYLDLTGNRISDISFITSLSNLEILNLSSNQISDFFFLASLSNLTYLYLDNNQIFDISFITSLSNLTYLSLSKNQISDISFLASLSNLTSLNLNENQIFDISFFASLSNLTTLSLSENQISDISFLVSLSNLTYLNLWNNRISDISFITSLSNLTTLSLSENQISNISFLASLSNLTDLSLSENQIFDISFLTSLNNLKVLGLRENQISDISSLASLSNLTHLGLALNQISDISFLASLSNLAYLDLRDNQISDISFLESLTNLKELYLSDNQISAIYSDFLNHFPKLKNLFLYGNPIKEIPTDIFGKTNLYNCLETVRHYFQDGENNGWDENKDLKIVLIGNGNVGKTSLVKRLVKNEFDENYDSTHGIQLRQYPDLQPYNINIWDFGGQDIYHATHRLFMQTRALFLVLWDWETEQTEKQQITENNKINEYQNHGLDYWLNYVSVLGKGSKAIVVQTKAIKHGIKNHLNENNLRQKYADIWLDSVAIDSQENNWAKNGFKKLKLAIENALESGEALRQEQLPKNWIAQREDIYKLIENKEKIIGYDYFVTEMCQNKTISPDTILSWLSDSGVVFYREGLFENKIIIDQQWAIDAVYTLFDRKKYYYRLKEAKGKFTKEDLKEFWENYKTPEQELFLSFMISCEICYKFENQYIAPALLPAEKEGESLTDFWQGKVFDTEKYEFTFLHYGIIQGFIVRLNNFRSENIAVQSVWQYGIFFKYNNLYASVKANLQDKTILVSVSHSEDQSLLNKIQNLIYELDSKENIKIIYSQDRKINENDKFENDKKQISLEDLTNDIEKALRNMMDLKHNPNEKENPYNDVLASHLKMIYEIADQSRGGISHKGNDLGEKDIVINSSSGEFSIIEALRLSSIKEIIDTHIFKLINNYDTQGHKRNYIVVYAQAKNFLNLWNKYKIYVNDLNNKPFFQKSKYPQIGNFEEKESDITDLKKGISKYRREGSEVEIYHFFVNMFLDKK